MRVVSGVDYVEVCTFAQLEKLQLVAFVFNWDIPWQLRWWIPFPSTRIGLINQKSVV